MDTYDTGTDAALLEQLAALQEENSHLKRQVAMAISLRYHLMPQPGRKFSDLPQADVYGDQISLAEIGGDFFDYFRIDSDHIAIVIADIFDGGNAAALYMVAFKLFLMGELDMGFSPDKLFEVVNGRLVKVNEDDLCLSAWFGIYEISTGRIRAVNAGHEPPLLKGPNGIRRCPSEKISFLLAVVEDMQYTGYEFTLNEGEQLLLYTDGVSKAKNADGELFGEEGIISAFAASESSDADGIIGDIQEELFAFIGKEKFADDATMVCLNRKGAAV